MIRTSLCLAAASLTFLAGASAASAKEFNDRSIRGTWALSVEGFVGSGAINALVPEGTPLFAIARVIFDGQGGCRSDDQIVAGGLAIPEDPDERRVASGCTYEVQPDGYGVFFVTFDEPGGPTVTTARFIIETAKRISFIADNVVLGIYGGGTLVRQSASIR